jgi:hypothetical protein
MAHSSLEINMEFPLTKRKSRLLSDLVTQLHEFLEHSVNLKKKFRRVIFQSGNIYLFATRYRIRISSRNGFRIIVNISNPDRIIPVVNRDCQLIFGFLNTLDKDEFRHAHFVGNYSTDNPHLISTSTASLIDRKKLVQASNRMKTAIRPVGQILQFYRENVEWVVATARFGKKPILGLFFHMVGEGALPNDLIVGLFNGCLNTAKKIKSSLNVA